MKIPLTLLAALLLVPIPTALGAVHYVDAHSVSPSSPYLSWASAAVTIQDAVDAAVAGDDILVTNGVYATGGRAVYGTLTNRVAVDKVVAVQSINGPLFTVIQGLQGPANTDGIRCVYLAYGASLTGFTVTNGGTRLGGDLFQERSGGGITAAFAGGTAAVSNCIIAGNWASYYGGGVYGVALYNCLLTQNSATNSGGGSCSNALSNCTLIGNFAPNGGGVFGSILKNCIVYGNSGPNGSNFLASFLLDSCTTPQPPDGSGNLVADPLFVDSPSGNFRLRPESPCIDAGNDSYAPAGPDLDGNPRVVGAAVDMGAYEYQGLVSPIAPYITTQPTDQTVTVGSNATFSVVAAGSLPLYYQWNVNGFVLDGATNSYLTVTNVQLGQSGTVYSVTATNQVGSVTSRRAVLTVSLATPYITTQPADLTVTVGSNATFSVVAGGSLPLYYQWYTNGVVLNNATNPSLTLTNVQVEQSGTVCSVTVTNLGGSVTSRSALLTVSPALAENWMLTSAPINTWTCVACSADGVKLVATAGDYYSSGAPGAIYTSADSGATWALTTAPTNYWVSVASCADGTKLAAVARNFNASRPGQICISTNSGVTWTVSAIPANDWSSVAASADGTKLTAVAYNGAIYTSTNLGASWISSATPQAWTCVTCSADGSKLVAASSTCCGVNDGGNIFTSTNFGTTWEEVQYPPQGVIYPSWGSVCSSADGTKLAIMTSEAHWGMSAYSVPIFLSRDSGGNWTGTADNWYWYGAFCIASSADGTKLAAVGPIGDVTAAGNSWIFTSTDEGQTWGAVGSIPPLPGEGASVASSADGTRLVAAAYGGGIYTWGSTPTPLLNITSSGSSMHLSWLIPTQEFVLEQSSDLQPANWTKVFPTPTLNYTNLNYEVTLGTTAGATFYRLRAN